MVRTWSQPFAKSSITANPDNASSASVMSRTVRRAVIEDDRELRDDDAPAHVRHRRPDGSRVSPVLNRGATAGYLDLMMPVMDGWEFRRRQRADPGIADIPVVCCQPLAGALPVPSRRQSFLPCDFNRRLTS